MRIKEYSNGDGYIVMRPQANFDRVLPEFQNHAGPAICEVFMHPEQLFVPKLSLATRADDSLVSPPLEDLSPVIPRPLLKAAMLVGVHPKSELINP